MTDNNNINDSTTCQADQNNDTFSPECPKLLKTHYEHLRNSGISLEVIKERGYESVLVKKRLRELGFSKMQQRTPGILIPLHGVDGSIVNYQYKPDNPRETKAGKRVKYEQPPNSGIRFDVPPRCRKHLGNPSIPLIFTEGAKKADAAVSHSSEVCIINLSGVWGFKGKNPFGGTTVLETDFQFIEFKNREVYIAYDSDINDNPGVFKACEQLANIVSRKGGKSVKRIYFEPDEQGNKVGLDDYLVQGKGTLADLFAQAQDKPREKPKQRLKSHETYCIEDERLCWIKSTTNGDIIIPLCNFNAVISEDITRDDGYETTRVFRIKGNLHNGYALPSVNVPAVNFNSLNWVSHMWGTRAVIAAGQALKDRLREAIQLQSQDASQRVIYMHTGWREINGEWTFLTGNGALDIPNVDVELGDALQRYKLPAPTGDPMDAVKASLEFLEVGRPEVTIPLWSTIYLAPLSEVVPPAFTLWIVGPTGVFKTTVTALALCHFGDFDVKTMPGSWYSTVNQLEKLLAMAKDVPMVIDDWAPASDMGKQREYEAKAERIARAQANRQGRGRLRSDTSFRPTYVPRGVPISTGEQLPSGQSHSARLFTVEMDKGDIDKARLTLAQDKAGLYPQAMAHYIRWLKGDWETIRGNLPSQWRQWRNQAQIQKSHPRLPEAIAWLYTGLTMGLTFADSVGAISHTDAEKLRKDGLTIFYKLAESQAERVARESPGQRFIEALSSLLDQGRVVLTDKTESTPPKVAPNQVAIGWKDGNEFILLNPKAAYSAVHESSQKTAEPFTFKENPVWQDLKRLGYTICEDGRTTVVTRIYSTTPDELLS